MSNTIGLNNWTGLIVEASQERANNIRDYHMGDDITVLNFAVTGRSNTKVKLY